MGSGFGAGQLQALLLSNSMTFGKLIDFAKSQVFI